MPYAYLTLSQLQTQLAERLSDLGNVYWSAAELIAYLQEAMRTWQSLSGYWRGRMTFNTSPTIPFYDLTAQPSSLVPFTLKDSDLASEILYHLLEPQLSGSPLAYVGTDMFTLDDIARAIERRRNQFLVETGMVLTVSTIPAGSPPVSRVSLADNVIDVRRVCLIEPLGPYGVGLYGAGPYGGSSIKRPLWRTSEWSAQSYSPGWATSPSDPTVGYSIAAEPPLTITLIPPESLPAQLELVTQNAGLPLNPSTGVLLGIPDNLAWVVKWGALADLLSKSGQAQDIARATYCEQRWRDGIQVARIHTSAVWGAVDGVETFISSVDGLDAFNPQWEASVGPPSALALASWNLIAASPVPDSGPHSIRLDVVQNAPVPVAATDQVQIGREELDVLLDYSEHLALFKSGGVALTDTVYLYSNMQRLASVYNERLAASVDFAKAMASAAQMEEVMRPRRTPVEQTA